MGRHRKMRAWMGRPADRALQVLLLAGLFAVLAGPAVASGAVRFGTVAQASVVPGHGSLVRCESAVTRAVTVDGLEPTGLGSPAWLGRSCSGLTRRQEREALAWEARIETLYGS